MASYYSKWVGGDDWRLRLDVTTTTGNTGYTYAAKLYLESKYGYFRSPSTSYTITIDGTSKTGTSSTGFTTNDTIRLGSASKTVSRGTSAKTVKFSFSAKITNSTISSYKSGTSGSGSVSLPAKPSYKVTFNANGGSGAPAAQTKWYGTTLKLSTTKPTRTGYTFKGWGTSSTSTSVAYAPGANYTANAADTLYAIWTEITYTITFNANGGTGGPTTQTKYYTKTLTLSTSKPTRTNYNFLGWATSASATTAQYQPGGSFTTNVKTTLYAVWELAYVAPSITDVSADRATSAGTISDEGTYAKIGFTWTLDATNSGGLKSITIGHKLTSATTYTNTTVTASGTSGTVSQVIGAGALNTEYEYDILITVTDQKGSSTYSVALPAMSYIIDFSPDGGVSLGAPAENAERFDVHIPEYHHDSVTIDGQLNINSPYTYANHIALRNNQAIAGILTTGDLTSILSMNSSDQVELNWTSGGLRGRCFKKIWSGNAAPGSTITVSEMPYYNLFAVEQSYNNLVMLVTRGKNLSTDSYFGGSMYAKAGGMTFMGVSFQSSGSSTKVEVTYCRREYASGGAGANMNVVGIYGLL